MNLRLCLHVEINPLRLFSVAICGLVIRKNFSLLQRLQRFEVAVHFNKTPHTLGDFSFQCIDQVQAHNNSEEIDRLLITKEAYWSAQLSQLGSSKSLVNFSLYIVFLL